MNVRMNSTTGQSPQQRKNQEEKIKAQQSAGALNKGPTTKRTGGCKVEPSGKYADK